MKRYENLTRWNIEPVVRLDRDLGNTGTRTVRHVNGEWRKADQAESKIKELEKTIQDIKNTIYDEDCPYCVAVHKILVPEPEVD